MASGLVIGKFMPPHAGHQYLIDFAREFVEELTVQVCAIQAERSRYAFSSQRNASSLSLRQA